MQACSTSLLDTPTHQPQMYVYAFMISSHKKLFHCARTAAIIYACTQVMKTKESITVLNVWQSLDINEFHGISLFFLFVPCTDVWKSLDVKVPHHVLLYVLFLPFGGTILRFTETMSK